MAFTAEYKTKIHEALLVQVWKEASLGNTTGYSILTDDTLARIVASSDTEIIKEKLYHQVFVYKALAVEQNEQGTGTAQDATQIYVKLGLLLGILNRQLKKATTPYVTFNLDAGDNRYRTIDGHLSIDPEICLLPSTLQGLLDGQEGLDTPLVYDLLINTSAITRTLDEHISRDAQVALLDFFERLFSEIERVTGVINKYELQYYEESSSFTVVDRNHIDTVPKAKFPKLSIFGLDSTVKNLGLVSKLSPKISSQIAISAQDSPFTSNTEGTGFNALSKDLEQSITNTLQDASLTVGETNLEEATTTYKQALEAFEQDMVVIFTHLNAIYGVSKALNVTDAYTVSSIYQNYCNMVVGKKNDPAYSFIIPFELNLTLHGISGIRVLESFRINKNILPSTYGGERGTDIAFVITGVEHQVNKAQWVTNIKTQIYNINDDGTVNDGKSYEKFWKLGATDTFTGARNAFTGPTPNADKLRAELKTLGYSEKGTELTSGGDLDENIVKAAIAVARKLKNDFSTNLTVIFTAGNDMYHQGISEYTSRHTAGTAVDFTVSPDSGTNLAKVKQILQGFSVGTGGQLRFLDEYSNPTKKATGKHFHMSWGGPTEGNTTFAEAKKLADAGKLVPNFIA